METWTQSQTRIHVYVNTALDWVPKSKVLAMVGAAFFTSHMPFMLPNQGHNRTEVKYNVICS